jgi:hypothetical protein
MPAAAAISADRRAAPADHPGRDERGGSGEHDQHRGEDEPELRHAEVELGLEGGEADQQAAAHAGEACARDEADEAAGAFAFRARGGLVAAFDHEDRVPDQGQAGAADQHQVRGTPEGHVLPEEPVPDVVEREAREREGSGDEQHDAAERGVPAGRDLDRHAAWPLLR